MLGEETFLEKNSDWPSWVMWPPAWGLSRDSSGAKIMAAHSPTLEEGRTVPPRGPATTMEKGKLENKPLVSRFPSSRDASVS